MSEQTPKADYEEPFAALVADLAAEVLRPGPAGEAPTREALVALFDLVADNAARLEARMAEIQPPPRPVACRKGCSFCCNWYEVQVTPLEAERIAAWIAENFSEEETEALRARVRETNRQKRRLPPGRGRPGFRCPLLVDGACSIHPARPFACRGYTAYRAEDCATRSGPIEGYVHPQKIAQAVIDGLRAAISRRGLADSVLDLSLALDIVLDDAGAGARWAAGDRVFAPAESHILKRRP